MPNILFASNNISHFPGGILTSDANKHDAARVPYGMAFTQYLVSGSPIFAPSTGDDTWMSFQMYADNGQQNRSGTCAALTDGNGLLICDISKNAIGSNTLQVEISNGVSTTSALLSDPTIDSVIQKYDVKLTVTPLKVEATVYKNNIQQALVTLSTNEGSVTAPVQVILGGGMSGVNAANNVAYSEIIIADGDTRNARLDLLRPAAAGTFEDWDGSLATLADDDPTTGMTTLNANDVQTMTLTTYTGAANISNLVAVSTSIRGQNSPSQIKHLIRMSAVDYESVNYPVDYSLSTAITDWNINPATSLPWTSSDIAALELGFKSVT